MEKLNVDDGERVGGAVVVLDGAVTRQSLGDGIELSLERILRPLLPILWPRRARPRASPLRHRLLEPFENRQRHHPRMRGRPSRGCGRCRRNRRRRPAAACTG